MEEAFEQEIERTVAALKAGKTILYPTDTIWGVGCDATNNKACLRVYAVKQRPLTCPPSPTTSSKVPKVR